MSDKLKQDLVNRLIGSQEGRRKLAQSMIAPIRQRLDYTSVGRKTFLVDEIWAFVCPDCGFRHVDKDYQHPYEECVANGVMES